MRQTITANTSLPFNDVGHSDGCHIRGNARQRRFFKRGLRFVSAMWDTASCGFRSHSNLRQDGARFLKTQEAA